MFLGKGAQNVISTKLQNTEKIVQDNFQILMLIITLMLIIRLKDTREQ